MECIPTLEADPVSLQLVPPHLHTWVRKWLCECDGVLNHISTIDARAQGCTMGRFVFWCSVCLEPGYEVDE